MRLKVFLRIWDGLERVSKGGDWNVENIDQVSGFPIWRHQYSICIARHISEGVSFLSHYAPALHFLRRISFVAAIWRQRHLG